MYIVQAHHDKRTICYVLWFMKYTNRAQSIKQMYIYIYNHKLSSTVTHSDRVQSQIFCKCVLCLYISVFFRISVASSSSSSSLLITIIIIMINKTTIGNMQTTRNCMLTYLLFHRTHNANRANSPMCCFVLAII